jgi:poly-beta-1,6-N-acetyl-D-glucosamine synthase
MFYLGIVLFSMYLVFKFLYIIFPLVDKKKADSDVKIARYKSFAVLVPAYNEESVILNCINSLTGLQYPNYKVYVIDDGSTDGTFDVLSKFLSLVPVKLREDTRLTYKKIISAYRSVIYPKIYVISKENGGKADALNAGIACCCEEIVITLDADCMLKEDAVSIMNRRFQNGYVVAAGGAVHITQSISSRSKSNIAFKLKDIIRYQVVQYLIAFYLHKFTQSGFNSLIVISGAYGAFKRHLLIRLNGYRKSVGEDMDITLKIQQYIKTNKKRYILSFVPESICFTECPESFKNLFRQRIRWQKAFIDCAVKYGLKMFRRFRPAISFFFIFDYFILGTLSTFLFLLVPVFMIISAKLYLIFLILFSADFIMGIIECAASKKAAAKNNFIFAGTDNLRVNIFIPFKMMLFRFLNILFVVTGTFSYIVSRERWNKAERLGRYFIEAGEEDASASSLKRRAKADYTM